MKAGAEAHNDALGAIRGLLATARQRGSLDAAGCAQLRGALLRAGPTRAEVDTELAEAWRATDADVHVHVLRDALEGLVLGPALVGALLDSVDGGATSSEEEATRVDEQSANAALWVLREAADDPLEPRGWRRIGRVARRERDQAVPNLEAATLLAERGPAACYATVALIAFRAGPEDALDRLAALSALGRFDEPPVAAWLQAVVASGGAVMEAVQALSFVAVRSHAAGDEATLETVIAALLAAVPVRDAPDDTVANGDGWSRWLALDLLSRLLGEAAIPMLQAAHAAGGQYDVPWLLPQIAARVESLGGACPAPAGAALPWVPPLPDLQASVASRSPRVARRAATLAADQPELQAAVRRRAAVEAALVARGQLLASFLDAGSGDGGAAASPAQAVALDPAFRPWSEVLSDADRTALIAAEAAWLA